MATSHTVPHKLAQWVPTNRLCLQPYPSPTWIFSIQLNFTLFFSHKTKLQTTVKISKWNGLLQTPAPASLAKQQLKCEYHLHPKYKLKAKGHPVSGVLREARRQHESRHVPARASCLHCLEGWPLSLLSVAVHLASCEKRDNKFLPRVSHFWVLCDGQRDQAYS